MKTDWFRGSYLSIPAARLQCPGPGPRLPSEATAGRQTVSRQGIVSAPACAFCWNGLRIPATWWWARMRIGAGFRIRSGRAAGNNLTCSQCRTVGAGKQGVRVDGAFC